MTKTVQEPELSHSGDRVADAVEGSWVDTSAAAWMRPYLRLSRMDRPIGTWLLLLPCWWGLLLALAAEPGSIRVGDIWIFLGCALGAAAMRGAGCTWNDAVDRDLDRQVERTKSRPLPSGQVTVLQALIWLALQGAVGLAVLLTFNRAAIYLGFASLLPVIAYPFAKRFTWWPQVMLGIAFNWGAMLAWAAHAGNLGATPLLLYGGGIAWTLFYDTIYAHQDKEDDALVGIKSTALLFGENTKAWLSLFAAAATILIALAVWTAIPIGERPVALLLGFLGTASFAAHLIWQIRKLDMADGECCLRLFRSNRNAGLLLSATFFIAACAGVS